jgi:hypothetical protein
MDFDLIADEFVESANKIKSNMSTSDIIELTNKKYDGERGFKTSQIQLDTDDEDSELTINEIEEVNKDELGNQEEQSDDGESVIKLVQTSVDEAIKNENSISSHMMKQSSNEESEMGSELTEVSDTKFIEEAEAVTNLALSSSKKTDTELLAENQDNQQDDSEFIETGSETNENNQDLLESSDALINLTLNSAKESDSSKKITELQEKDDSELRTDELVQLSDSDIIKKSEEMAINLQTKEEESSKGDFMTREMSREQLDELVGSN